MNLFPLEFWNFFLNLFIYLFFYPLSYLHHHAAYGAYWVMQDRLLKVTAEQGFMPLRVIQM